MARVLLGALGKNTYEEVRYDFPDGGNEVAHIFLLAYARHIQPDCVCVLLTPEARQLHWEALRTQLHACGIADVQEVPIHKGATVDELWQNFDALTGCIHQGDEVFFDVTNALRSLPLVFMNALVYLRSARDITIREIRYGAYDAVEKDVTLKPVFALDPFMALGDWSHAVQVFRRTGDCALIADRLDEAHAIFPALTAAAKEMLRQSAHDLRSLALALDLGRPIEAMEGAKRVTARFDTIPDLLASLPQAFATLLEQVRREFAQFAFPESALHDDLSEHLRRQLCLIRWCFDHQRIHTTYLLAVEWILSWAMLQQGRPKDAIFIYNERNKIKGDFTKSDTRLPEKACQLWKEAREIRNDLAHAGIESGRRHPAKEISSKVGMIVAELEDLGADL